MKKRAKKSKTSIKAPIILSIITIVLILMLGAGLILSCLTGGFGFKPIIGKNAKQPDVVDVDEGENPDMGSGDLEPGDAVVDNTYVLQPASSQFIRLVATQVVDSEEHKVRLTATISPDYALDKSVEWTIAFANPQSEWASGKTVTDYVTVTPVEDGANEADVQGIAAFGEQIVITASARTNAEATATCTVDYQRRRSIKNIEDTQKGERSGVKLVTQYPEEPYTIDTPEFDKYTLSYSQEFQSIICNLRMLFGLSYQPIFPSQTIADDAYYGMSFIKLQSGESAFSYTPDGGQTFKFSDTPATGNNLFKGQYYDIMFADKYDNDANAAIIRKYYPIYLLLKNDNNFKKSYIDKNVAGLKDNITTSTELVTVLKNLFEPSITTSELVKIKQGYRQYAQKLADYIGKGVNVHYENNVGYVFDDAVTVTVTDEVFQKQYTYSYDFVWVSPEITSPNSVELDQGSIVF